MQFPVDVLMRLDLTPLKSALQTAKAEVVGSMGEAQKAISQTQSVTYSRFVGQVRNVSRQANQQIVQDHAKTTTQTTEADLAANKKVLSRNLAAVRELSALKKRLTTEQLNAETAAAKQAAERVIMANRRAREVVEGNAKQSAGRVAATQIAAIRNTERAQMDSISRMAKAYESLATRMVKAQQSMQQARPGSFQDSASQGAAAGAAAGVLAGRGGTFASMAAGGGAVAAGLGVGVNTAVKAFASYEAQLNRIRAISDATTEDMEAVQRTALALGAATKFSATEAAEGIAELSAAGMTIPQALDSIQGVMGLAAAGGTSVGDAANTAAASLNGFRLQASDATRVADVFAKAANLSAISLTDVAYSMKYTAPIAAAAGASLEDVASVLVELGNAGIKGEQAGTSLRAIFSSFANPGKEARETLKALNVQLVDAKGNIRPFADAFADLRKAMTSMGSAERMKVSNVLFGDSASTAATVILQRTTEQLAATRREMGLVAGASTKMADTMNSGMVGALEQANGALDTMWTMLGRDLAPAIIKVSGLVQDMAGAWGNLSPNVKQTILTIGGFVGLIGSATAIVGSLGLAWMAVKPVLIGAGVLIGALELPVLAVVGGVAALLIGVGFLTKKFLEHNDAITETEAGLKAQTAALTPLLEKIDALKAKQSLTTDEQQELNKAIGEVAKIVPGVVTQYDSMGRAVDLNREKVEKHTQAIKDNAAQLAEQAKQARIAEQVELDALNARIINYRSQINSPNLLDSAGLSAAQAALKAMEDEYRQRSSALESLQRQAGVLNTPRIPGPYSPEYNRQMGENRFGPFYSPPPSTPGAAGAGRRAIQNPELEARIREAVLRTVEGVEGGCYRYANEVIRRVGGKTLDSMRDADRDLTLRFRSMRDAAAMVASGQIRPGDAVYANRSPGNNPRSLQGPLEWTKPHWMTYMGGNRWADNMGENWTSAQIASRYGDRQVDATYHPYGANGRGFDSTRGDVAASRLLERQETAAARARIRAANAQQRLAEKQARWAAERTEAEQKLNDRVDRMQAKVIGDMGKGAFDLVRATQGDREARDRYLARNAKKAPVYGPQQLLDASTPSFSDPHGTRFKAKHFPVGSPLSGDVLSLQNGMLAEQFAKGGNAGKFQDIRMNAEGAGVAITDLLSIAQQAANDPSLNGLPSLIGQIFGDPKRVKAWGDAIQVVSANIQDLGKGGDVAITALTNIGKVLTGSPESITAIIQLTIMAVQGLWSSFDEAINGPIRFREILAQMKEDIDDINLRVSVGLVSAFEAAGQKVSATSNALIDALKEQREAQKDLGFARDSKIDNTGWAVAAKVRADQADALVAKTRGEFEGAQTDATRLSGEQSLAGQTAPDYAASVFEDRLNSERGAGQGVAENKTAEDYRKEFDQNQASAIAFQKTLDDPEAAAADKQAARQGLAAVRRAQAQLGANAKATLFDDSTLRRARYDRDVAKSNRSSLINDRKGLQDQINAGALSPRALEEAKAQIQSINQAISIQESIIIGANGVIEEQLDLEKDIDSVVEDITDATRAQIAEEERQAEIAKRVNAIHEERLELIRAAEEKLRAINDSWVTVGESQAAIVEGLARQAEIRQELVELARREREDLEGVRNESIAVRALTEAQDKQQRMQRITEDYAKQRTDLTSEGADVANAVRAALSAWASGMSTIEGYRNSSAGSGNSGWNEITAYQKSILDQLALPTFHGGGPVPGGLNQEQLIRARGGEHVLTAEQAKLWRRASSGAGYGVPSGFGRAGGGGGLSVLLQCTNLIGSIEGVDDPRAVAARMAESLVPMLNAAIREQGPRMYQR